MVMYYAHESMISTVLLVAFNVMAMEKMNISALLKCFIIHSRGSSKQIKKKICARLMLIKKNTIFVSLILSCII